jgi:hypothetical protein
LLKILKMAVVTMTLKIHHDEKFLPVLVLWHQISQAELSIHHRVHEIAQDRLGIFDCTWLTFICWHLFVENPQNGSQHNDPKNPPWWNVPSCPGILTPNITNWTVNSSQGSWSCPGQAQYIWQHMADFYLLKMCRKSSKWQSPQWP